MPIEPLQTTLIVVLIVLTIAVVTTLVFIVLIMIELKKAAKILNTVLEDMHKVGNMVTNPLIPALRVLMTVFPQAKGIIRSMLKNRRKEN